MRRLILKMSISIDGFVAGPNGELDWIFTTTDEASTRWTMATVTQAGAHLMGSRTFQDMAAFWPTSTDVFAAPMNDIPKVVFSHDPSLRPDVSRTTAAFRDAMRRRTEPLPAPGSSPHFRSWAEAEIADGANLPAEVARLKAQPGKDLVAHGGAAFARALVTQDLVDEYRLLVHPVALGRGLALFADLPALRTLRLIEAIAFPAGAVAHLYGRD